ncbi:unnamed protein product [Musa banksii]
MLLIPSSTAMITATSQSMPRHATTKSARGAPPRPEPKTIPRCCLVCPVPVSPGQRCMASFCTSWDGGRTKEGGHPWIKIISIKRGRLPLTRRLASRRRAIDQRLEQEPLTSFPASATSSDDQRLLTSTREPSRADSSATLHLFTNN